MVWLEKKTNKYVSPEVQNKLITLNSTRKLSINFKFLLICSSIMIDETPEITNQEEFTFLKAPQ